MSITEDEVRQDWKEAVGLDKVDVDPDALTIRQLMVLLNLPSRGEVLGWANRGVAAGTVEEVRVFRQAVGGGHRWLKAYKLVGKVTAP